MIWTAAIGVLRLPKILGAPRFQEVEMKRLFSGAGSLLFLGAAVFGQTAPPPPSFEAADVRTGQPTQNAAMRSSFSRGRYELHNASMVDLISTAYDMESESVYGG